MRLNGKMAIVTGASSGIGSRAAMEFGRQGARVCCADPSVTGAQAMADQIKKEDGK